MLRGRRAAMLWQVSPPGALPGSQGRSDKNPLLLPVEGGEKYPFRNTTKCSVLNKAYPQELNLWGLSQPSWTEGRGIQSAGACRPVPQREEVSLWPRLRRARDRISALQDVHCPHTASSLHGRLTELLLPGTSCRRQKITQHIKRQTTWSDETASIRTRLRYI